MKESTADPVNRWGVSSQFQNKRSRKVKKHYDELCQDERLSSDSKKNFQTSTFNTILDSN